MAGVALLIAVLPSILYIRARRADRTLQQIAQVDPSARIIELRGEGTNLVILPPSPQWIVFSLPVRGEFIPASYGATITRSDGKQVWQAPKLTSQSAGKLTFVLSSSDIEPGHYTINVKRSDGGANLVSSSFIVHASHQR